MTCPVFKRYCSEHGFVHGAEAEELRHGIEKILSDACDEDDFRRELRRLLEQVDARDSVAFLEASPRVRANSKRRANP